MFSLNVTEISHVAFNFMCFLYGEQRRAMFTYVFITFMSCRRGRCAGHKRVCKHNKQRQVIVNGLFYSFFISILERVCARARTSTEIQPVVKCVNIKYFGFISLCCLLSVSDVAFFSGKPTDEETVNFSNFSALILFFFA